MQAKVAVIGSGNWGSTVARMIAKNLTRQPSLADYDRTVEMYTREETLPDGGLLTEAINRYHQNVRYLPGVILPENVHATADLAFAVKDATVIVMTSPHQYVPDLLADMAPAITAEQRENLAFVNLSKGVHFDAARGLLLRMSELAGEILQLPAIRLAALSGPNVAPEVAAGHFTEACVACQSPTWRQTFIDLFASDTFAVRPTADVAGVELGGALKNVVAIAAGFIDGLEMGNNAKATVIRIGMEEMYRFASLPDLGTPPSRATFDGPAFLGDVLTSCYGGRNRRFGEEVGRDFRQGRKPIDVQDFERVVLRGQKVQGYETAIDCIAYLDKLGRTAEFPLFRMVRDAIENGIDPRESFLKILHAPGA